MGAGDLAVALDVERSAFGQDEEANLVRALMADPTAEPRLSLLAMAEGRAVGHILFTGASVEGAHRPVAASILAPMAVTPKAQSQGYGGQLIAEGLRRLTSAGVELIFVLGHPGYYPRFGFEPALPLGFEAPFPIAEEHADAWMLLALRNGVVGSVAGKVKCADALNRPELWRE